MRSHAESAHVIDRPNYFGRYLSFSKMDNVKGNYLPIHIKAEHDILQSITPKNR